MFAFVDDFYTMDYDISVVDGYISINILSYLHIIYPAIGNPD